MTSLSEKKTVLNLMGEKLLIAHCQNLKNITLIFGEKMLGGNLYKTTTRCTWLLLFILQPQPRPGCRCLVQASHHHVVSLDFRLLRRQLLALQFQTAKTERRGGRGMKCFQRQTAAQQRLPDKHEAPQISDVTAN